MKLWPLRIAHYPAACGMALICAATGFSTPGWAAKADEGLFWTYTVPGDGSSVSFDVCGQLGGGSGCFGTSYLGPFERACAVLEGKPKTKDNVIKRAIYVLDKRKSENDPIVLNVYLRTDVIDGDQDAISVSLKRQVTLDITGGTQSRCTMAASDLFVYAATDADNSAAAVDTKTFNVTQVAGPSKIVAITADDRGYVTLHCHVGFYVYGPDGTLRLGGGGTGDMVNTRNAWVPEL